MIEALREQIAPETGNSWKAPGIGSLPFAPLRMEKVVEDR